VTYLRLEVVGPRMVYVTGDVDLTGDDIESHVAVRLRALEAKVLRVARGGRRRAEPVPPPTSRRSRRRVPPVAGCSRLGRAKAAGVTALSCAENQ